MGLNILIVDDEADIRDLISDLLREEGFSTNSVANSSQALNAIQQRKPDIVILDVWLQDSNLDGLGLLEVIKEQYPDTIVIMISGHGTIDNAIYAIKNGAYDYLEKPFRTDKLLITVKRASESVNLSKENAELRSGVIDKTKFIGSSSITVKLMSEVSKVASSNGRVLIHGDVGNGKELIARIIHKKSKMSTGSFVLFNPTLMSLGNIHQELFGTDAREKIDSEEYKRVSLIEKANNGTLYIDEITDLPMPVQQRLLKFLREGTLINSSGQTIPINLRIISSTSKDLDVEIANGRFRKDLYYRLNIMQIKVPKLSERKEDIPLLVKHFIERLSFFFGLKKRIFSEDAIIAMQSYSWPGNVRQLCNVVEWTLIMNPASSNKGYINSSMLPQEVINDSNNVTQKSETGIDIMSISLREAREIFEKQYLKAQMNRFNNNISKTSAFVGMERSALHRKLKTLNIHSTNTYEADKEKESAI